MSQFQVAGDRPLEGTVAVSGAKNAALPIMAASLLAEGPLILDRVPDVSDVRTMSALLKSLGMRTERFARHSLLLEPADNHAHQAPHDLVRAMRASICVLAPLLVRRRRAEMPLPGGCNLGPRPIDLHLRTLAAFGAKIQIAKHTIIANAKRLHAANVSMRGPHGSSVTGTATALMAAITTPGISHITDAAREPEISDLAAVLSKMGGKIQGAGTDEIIIEGVQRLGGTRHQLIGDRIEAATFLLATAITQGSVEVTGINPSHLRVVAAMLSRAGANLRFGANQIAIEMNRRPRGFHITAAPFPAIPTDLQPLWTALAMRANSPSHISDVVFPQRFQHLAQLRRFGTTIHHRIDAPNEVVVTPPKRLNTANVDAPDLRAAAALVLAALAAPGVSCINGIEHLDRGYESLDRKLRSLGAQVTRVEPSELTARQGAAPQGSTNQIPATPLIECIPLETSQT